MTLKSLDLMCGTSICWASKNNICIDLTIPSIEEINDIEDLDSKFTDEDLKTIIDNKYFIQLDLLKDRLPFKNESFDVIISSRGIGRRYENKYCTNEILRVLKKSGKLKLFNSEIYIVSNLAQYFDVTNIELINRFEDEFSDFNIVFSKKII